MNLQYYSTRAVSIVSLVFLILMAMGFALFEEEDSSNNIDLALDVRAINDELEIKTDELEKLVTQIKDHEEKISQL